MKMQPDRSDAQTINGHGAGWVSVSGQRIEHAVLVGSRGLLVPWGVERFDELTSAHFETLAAQGNEIVIFGSGPRLRFPPTAWLQPLMLRRIGLESMDSAAACRTYNILAAEGRNVLLALLLR